MPRASVIHVLRPAKGGMRGHVLSLVTGLDRDRFAPVVAGAVDGELRDLLADAAVASEVVPLPARPGPGLLRASRRWASLIAERRPDILHCHGLAAALVGRLAVGPAAPTPGGGTPRGRRPAVVVTVHNLPNWPPSLLRRTVNRWIERRLEPRTARYVAVSRAVRDQLVHEVGIAPEHVSVIHPGLDVARWTAADAGDRAAARAALGLPAAAPVVGMLSRLVPEKGPDLLLRAFARLDRMAGAARGLDADRPVLAVAGDGPMRAALERDARRAGLAGRVRFLGRIADPRAFLAAVDLLAAPSRAEGLGMSCLEAMARGRPVVAFATGGLREVVRDGEVGFLVPAGDVDALAAAMERILSDELIRRRMGASGRARVERRFTVGRMVKDTERLYDWLTSRPDLTRRRGHPS